MKYCRPYVLLTRAAPVRIMTDHLAAEIAADAAAMARELAGRRSDVAAPCLQVVDLRLRFGEDEEQTSN